MRAITKFAAAAVLSLSTMALASGANAATLVSVGTSGSLTPDSVQWDGNLGAPATGNLTSNSALVSLNFNDAVYNDGLLGQLAIFTLNATTSGLNTLSTEADGTLRQTGLNGFFEFRQASDPSVVLLRGDFTNAWLTGKDQAGSFMTVQNDGTLELSSAVVNLSFLKDDSASFGFSGVHDNFAAVDGNLRDFSVTTVSGTFSGAIPEPATWALMILGFGGAGAMLRRRKAVFA
jgi:hypothetical protein